MSKPDKITNIVTKCIEDIPSGSLASNEALLRLIASELATLIDFVMDIRNEVIK